MKILHTVETYYPYAGGMAEVVRQLSEHLVKLGHQVTVATGKGQLNLPEEQYTNGVRIIRYNVVGNIVQGIKGAVQNYRSFVLNSNFDIITNFAAQQWATDLTLPLLKRIPSKKVFVPTGFSALYSPEYKEYFGKMKEWMNLYDMNVFLSNDYRDIVFAKKNGVRNIMVIPNGADAKEFSQISKIDVREKYNIPLKNKVILLVGSHTGLKGHREAIMMFKEAKIHNATLLIIGNQKTSCFLRCEFSSLVNNIAHTDKRILIEEASRPITIAAYQQADLFLFPSNIECSPVVLFEAAASKTPFLVTDVGNAREIIIWLKSGKLLPTKIDPSGYSHAIIDESAKLLTDLLSDESLLADMSKKGYENWKSTFTWEKISQQYENLYLSLLKD